MRNAIRLIVLAALLTVPLQAQAQEIELKNDGFVDGGVAGFQQGFVAGEAWGSKFSAAPADYPLTVKRVQFLFGGGSTATENTTLNFWTNSPGGSFLGADIPGSSIGSSGEWQITGSDNSLTEIDVSADNITIASGEFWVTVDVTHAGAPGPARDDDGSIQPNTNALFASQLGVWEGSGALGLTGDWIIRVHVETAGGMMMMCSGTEFTCTNNDCIPAAQECDGTAQCGDGSDEAPSNANCVMAGDMGMADGGPADMSGGDMAVADTGMTGMDMGGASDMSMTGAFSITGVMPSSGPTDQDVLVQVTGNGFVDGITLRLDTNPLTNIIVGGASLANATVPAGTPVGTYGLIGQLPSGELFTLPAAYEVTGEGTTTGPAITAVLPSSGNAGELLTVSGSGFQDGIAANLGGFAIPIVDFRSENEIAFTVPAALAPGVHSLSVTNPDGGTATLPNAFTLQGAGGGGDGGCCTAVRQQDRGRPYPLLAVAFIGLGLLLRRRKR